MGLNEGLRSERYVFRMSVSKRTCIGTIVVNGLPREILDRSGSSMRESVLRGEREDIEDRVIGGLRLLLDLADWREIGRCFRLIRC